MTGALSRSEADAPSVRAMGARTRWGWMVALGLPAGCGGGPEQSCIGAGCSDTTSSGTGGSSGTESSPDDTSEISSDSDPDGGDPTGPICAVDDGHAFGICDLPWSCVEDRECPPSMICNAGFCEPAQHCDLDEDCSRGELCTDGVCRLVSCVDDDDCGEGQWCFGERCIAPTEFSTCGVAAGFELTQLGLAGDAPILELAIVGAPPELIALARGGRAVDLARWDPGELLAVATVSTDPADATQIAGSGALEGPAVAGLLAAGPELIVSPAGEDFGAVIPVDDGLVLDVAGLGVAPLALALRRDGATTNVRRYAAEAEGLGLVEDVAVDADAFALALAPDAGALLVLGPTSVGVYQPQLLVEFGETATILGNAGHPILGGAAATGDTGPIFALQLGGAMPGLWLAVGDEPGQLAALSTVPDAIALGDVDGDGHVDVALGDAGGVLLLRGVDGSDPCLQELALPGPVSTLAVADLDGDGGAELVAGTGTTLVVAQHGP